MKRWIGLLLAAAMLCGLCHAESDRKLYLRGLPENAEIPISETAFPDGGFRQSVQVFDLDGSGGLSEAEIAQAEYLWVDHAGLQSLQGVEYLSGLKLLDCTGNRLEQLDVSQCRELEYLYCGGNQLTVLALPVNAPLLELNCSGNCLKSLDISGCSSLISLNCSNNYLADLRLDANSSLELLYCQDNALSTLDISACARLIEACATQNRNENAADASNHDFVFYGERSIGLGLDASVKLAVRENTAESIRESVAINEGRIINSAFVQVAEHESTTGAAAIAPPLTVEKCRQYKGRIAAVNGAVMGVCSDGTVAVSGWGEKVEAYKSAISDWTDVVALCTYGPCAIKGDGSVVTLLDGSSRASFQIAEWENVIQMASNGTVYVGLTNDRTVLLASDNMDDEKAFQEITLWTDIVDVSVGQSCVVGLKSNGTVAAIGKDPSYPVDFANEWTDIVAVAAGQKDDIYAVRSNGDLIRGETQYLLADNVAYVEVSPWDSHKMPIYIDGTAGDEYAEYDDNDAVAVAVNNDKRYVLTQDGRVFNVDWYNGNNPMEGMNLFNPHSETKRQETALEPFDLSQLLYREDNGTIIVGGYQANTVVIEVPGEIDGKPVMVVRGHDGGTVFTRNSGFNDYMKTIILPEGLRTIGKCAFLGTQLESIDIPATVTVIGAEAFGGCKLLSEITIPGSVETIYDRAFSGCGVRRVTIEDGVKWIEQFAFTACGNLTEVTIPGSVTRLEYRAFSNCGNLRKVKIEEGVATLCEKCFMNCYNLQKITLPSSLRYIGKGLFQNCERLTDIYYNGSADQWAQIRIDQDNDILNSLTIHYR